MRMFVAILLGVVLGGFLAKFLFGGSAWNLIPWGLVGLGTGIFARNKREAIVSGALYGFVLSFLFMVSGYSGKAPLITRFAPFALLGLFGSFCGAILGLIGSFGRQLIQKDTVSTVYKRG